MCLPLTYMSSQSLPTYTMRTLLLVRDLIFFLLLLPFQYIPSLSELSVIYLTSLCPLLPTASKLEKSVGWLCVGLFHGKVTADDQ